MVQSGLLKPEPRVVKVANIVEFPTKLGNKCLLLEKLGLDAYWNTEEELLKALTESAERPEMFDICLTYSRCQRFWQAFKQGFTPFAERDPIILVEHEGRFWVAEGKHRVCLAKRAGVESLEALVYRLKEDTKSLLPPEGEPGRYYFSYSFGSGPRGVEDVRGTVAYLWVNSPPGVTRGRFDFRGAWLDASQSTGGTPVELFPGLRYRILVRRELERRGFFRRRERFVLESEVSIQPDHPRTKVWLLEVPAAEVSVLRPGAPSFRTVYRFGCWRRGHLMQLSEMSTTPH